MGEVVGIIMMAGMVIGMITSGFSAAQRECANEQQIADTHQQIADMAKTMQTAINELNQLDNILQDQINDVQVSVRQVMQQMILKKRDFALFLKKLQLAVAGIVLIVFVLLLAKKLKIF